MMRLTHCLVPLLCAGLVTACGPERSAPAEAPAIKVRGTEQDRLHQLGAFDLAIALKRAVYDAGYTCKQLTDAGFVDTYKNMDIWMAKCSEGRDWAVFTGPDGSAQVRDCKDVAETGLPACAIKRRPEGSFTQVPGSGAESEAKPKR